VLAGIEDLVGPEVPVAGGSSGDNDVVGRWSQLASGQCYTDAVVVSVLFPTTEVMYAFHNGYGPTDHRGIATKVKGRELVEIDGRPAALVYDEWTDGKLEAAVPGNFLAKTTLTPLGREVGKAGGVPYFLLSHPDTVTTDKTLTLYTSLQEGDELVQMRGTVDSLVLRAGNVARGAIDGDGVTPDEVAGAFVVYCSGCMLTVQERMSEVVDGLREGLADAPFLGHFSFGEQGCFLSGHNYHGNLMISVLMFLR